MFKLYIVLFLTVLSTVGCKSGCKSNGGGGEDPTGVTVCTPNPDLIAQELACQTTADCPCGTRCDLGECLAECQTSDDCAEGLVCDSFGRCSTEETAEQLFIPDTTSAGELQLPQTTFVLADEEVADITLTASDRGLTRGRIEARNGLKVQCPGAQAFSYECQVGQLEAAAAVDVQIVRTDVDVDGEPVDPADTAELVVFAPGTRETMTVSRPSDVATVPVAGRYEGTMQLIGAGSDPDLDALAAPAVRMQMAVTASMFEESADIFVVSIEDPLNALTSRDVFVGTITLDGEAEDDSGARPASASFPSHPFIETTVAGRTTTLVAASRDAQVRVNERSGSIGLRFTHTYEGAGAQNAPAVRWLVTLSRADDTSGSAPTVPADEVVPPIQVDRLTQPTPWESALGLAELPSAFAAANWALGSEELPAAMCDGELTNHALAQRIADGLLSPDAVSEQTPLERARPFDAAILEGLRSSGGIQAWQQGGNFDLETTETLAPTLIEGEIPCRFSNSDVLVATTSNSGSIFQLERTIEVPLVDICDQLQEATGCELSSTFRSWDSVGIVGDILADTHQNSARVRLVTEIERVCTLPVSHETCAERVSCLPDPDPGVSIFDSLGTTFGTTTSNGLGDLDCDGTARSGGFDFDDRASEENPETPWELAGAITDCLEELESLAAEPAVAADTSAAAFGGAECVDIGRMLSAFALQTMHRRTDGIGLSEAQQNYASAYLNRLLGRWLALHGYLATQSAQLDQMFGATALGAEIGVDRDVLARQMATGWDLLLAQHVLYELMSSPAAVSETPDYRAYRFPDETFDGDAPAGRALSPVILQTLTRQFELLQRRMSRPDSAEDTEGLTLLTEFIPRSLVAQALAADQFGRAGGEAAEWRGEYDRGAERTRSVGDRTFETVEQIRQGRNPLGIPDSELPLYFDLSLEGDSGARFTAVSDFIAGDGPDSGAWAPTMVNAAQETLTAAREAYAERVSQTVSEARAERTQLEWVERMKNDYNAKLREYCGPSDEDLISGDRFDAASCAVVATNAACTYNLEGWWASWTRSDLDGRICMASEISRAGVSTFGELAFVDADVASLATDCLADDAPSSDLSIVDCAGGMCLRCASSQTEVLLDSPAKLSLAIPESASANNADNLEVWRAATSACEPRHPSMRHEVPPTRSPFDTPGCVSGSLGEAYLDIVAATRDLELARAQQAEHVEAYDIAMKSCLILDQSNAQIARKSNAHGQIMHNLRAIKATTDSLAAAAAGTKDCLSGVAGTDNTNPINAIINSGAAIGACAAAAVETAFTIAGIGLQAAMDDAQSNFESEIAALEATRDVEICQNDARQQLVGARAASIAVEQAAFDLERAQAEIAAQIDDANQIWRDGHAYLTTITEFPVPSELGEPWYSERIDRYTRNFILARRATYLAVRAVEYEFQASLDLRATVYTAKVPADLEEILGELWTTSGTRSIGGSRPTELSAVVSLRDDILQAGDRTEWPEGFRLTTPSERFQMLLTAEQFAEYDGDGAYLGQRIPFSLVPLGALGLDTNGVSIYADTDCAERLWSINASLVGEDLYEGSDTSFVRLDVLKRNTFFSQWCGESPDGQRFQLASVTPTRNLFREPGIGEEVGSEFGVERGPESFGRARIQAFFGVDRAALEDPQYANGQTSELAGRGLYGDYALFIPAALISRDGSSGLVLSNIEDILLRVDYLSVARP